jgi:hypothetical protein
MRSLLLDGTLTCTASRKVAEAPSIVLVQSDDSYAEFSLYVGGILGEAILHSHERLTPK